MSGVLGLPVVVGTDGTRAGRDAVEWAAVEAEARSRRLSIVHAQPRLARSYELRWSRSPSPRAESERMLDEAVDHARTAAPDVAVTARTVVGGAVPALLGQFAELLVVGARDRESGGLVRPGVVSHAMCPVVVVRLQTSPDLGPPGSRPRRRRCAAGRVVVGASHTSSLAALEFAFRAAAQRGVGVTALLATPKTTVSAVLDEIAPRDDGDGDLWSRHVTAVARMRAAFPTVGAVAMCRSGAATDVLVEESDGAAMLVIERHERKLTGSSQSGV